MKIVSDDDVFIIPLGNNNKIVLVSSEYKDSLIDCLLTYFYSKKKNKCIVYDNDDVVKMDDISFIYIPNDLSFENNFEFKPKSIMNNEIENFISTNPDNFQTIETIRKNLDELITDKGFYKLKKIIGLGIEKEIQIEVNNLNINSLLQMLYIENNYLTPTEQYIMILNLLLYENRNDITIVYIDKYVDEKLLNWINIQNKNIYFILDNEAVFVSPDYFDLIVLSNCDHVIEQELTNSEIKNLIYMNHQIIKANISLQNEKNVEIFKEFQDKNSTFFLKNIIV